MTAVPGPLAAFGSLMLLDHHTSRAEQQSTVAPTAGPGGLEVSFWYTQQVWS